jgi:hypothetical protein
VEKQRAHSKLYLAGATKPPRVGKSKEEKEKEKEREKREKEEKDKAKREAKEREQEKARENSANDSGPIPPGTVLRKRTLTGDSRSGLKTGPNDGTRAVQSGAITLKPGENVLQQLNQIVGEADHSGFMLKKGERYNTWKMRYFFLKGPHLYYLRSKQVGTTSLLR